MGLLDRLLGREPRGADAVPRRPTGTPPYGTPPVAASARPERDPDDVAIERYRYLLRTAPPDAIEQAHAEAFEQLTPEQRRQVLTELTKQVPASERAFDDSPPSLARMATRAEMRRPGTLERTFNRGPGGMGMGGVIAGSLLASVAGAFVGTVVADSMFDLADTGDAGGAAAGDGAYADQFDAGGDGFADFGGGFGFGDAGGGGFGGGFGGGDF